jgi:ketosteroid isomerase-like protein
MSRENVEIVRKSLEALNPDLDAVAEFWHPEIDWRAIEGAPDDVGVFTGHVAMRRYYEQWFETFAELRAEIEEIVDAGEQVVVALHVVGKMEGSQAEIDMRLGIVCTVRNGLIVRGREYATREAALEAAGLRE